MPALQVRDFPDELYGRLRACAKQEKRSISAQTIVAIEAYLSPRRGVANNAQASFEREARIVKRKQLFAELEEANRIWEYPADFPSPAEIVREIRDER